MISKKLSMFMFILLGVVSMTSMVSATLSFTDVNMNPDSTLLNSESVPIGFFGFSGLTYLDGYLWAIENPTTVNKYLSKFYLNGTPTGDRVSVSGSSTAVASYNGFLYVFSSAEMYKYDQDLVGYGLITIFDSGTNGVAVIDDTLYYSMFGQVKKYNMTDPEVTVWTSIGSFTTPEITGFSRSMTSFNDYLYIQDSNNNLFIYNKNGTFVRSFSSGLSNVEGLAASSSSLFAVTSTGTINEYIRPMAYNDTTYRKDNYFDVTLSDTNSNTDTNVSYKINDGEFVQVCTNTLSCLFNAPVSQGENNITISAINNESSATPFEFTFTAEFPEITVNSVEMNPGDVVLNEVFTTDFSDRWQGLTYLDGYFWIASLKNPWSIQKYNLDGTFTGFEFDIQDDGVLAQSIVAYDGFLYLFDGGEMFKYNTNGSYTGLSYNFGRDSEANAISGDILYVVSLDNSGVYLYDMEGNYLNEFFATPEISIVPYGASIHGDYIYMINWQKTVYVYNIDGTFINTYSLASEVTDVSEGLQIVGDSLYVVTDPNTYDSALYEFIRPNIIEHVSDRNNNYFNVDISTINTNNNVDVSYSLDGAASVEGCVDSISCVFNTSASYGQHNITIFTDNGEATSEYVYYFEVAAPNTVRIDPRFADENKNLVGLANFSSYNSATLSYEYVWYVNGVSVQAAGETMNWVVNTDIISGADGLASTAWSTPTVFELNGQTKMLIGLDNGGYYGLKWENPGAGFMWLDDSATILSGITGVSAAATPDVFEMSGTTYMITGNNLGNWLGQRWTGSSWVVDASIISGLQNYDDFSTPTVFQKDGTWYLISGRNDGTFNGYNWNGSTWQVDTSIISGIPDVGSASSPDVFQKDGTWYLIVGEDNGKFNGFQWAGSNWVLNPSWEWDGEFQTKFQGLDTGLTDVGTYSTPAVYELDGTWYLISGAGTNNVYGFEMQEIGSNHTQGVEVSVNTFDYRDTSFGDEVKFSVRSYDGTSYSAWKNSSTTTIAQGVNLNSIGITPLNAGQDRDITGVANFSYINGTNLTYEYIWYVNDIEVDSGVNSTEVSQNTTTNIATLDSGNYTGYDEVIFSTRANYNGDVYSNWVNTSSTLIGELNMNIDLLEGTVVGFEDTNVTVGNPSWINIYYSIDGGSAVTVCNDCNTGSFIIPEQTQGAHTIAIIGTSGPYQQVFNRGFTYTSSPSITFDNVSINGQSLVAQWLAPSGADPGLGTIGSNSAATTFIKDGTTYLIASQIFGNANGFNWTGSAWVSDSNIISGLGAGSFGSRGKITSFEKDGTIYLIAGDYDGIFRGFNWTGSTWVSDSNIISGLVDPGLAATPDVFERDGTFYAIVGKQNGGFDGYHWTGSTWVANASVDSGLVDVGTISTSDVFERDGIWYFITTSSADIFIGYRWTGSTWVNDPNVVVGLGVGEEDITTTTFERDGKYYLITGHLFGSFYEYNLSGYIDEIKNINVLDLEAYVTATETTYPTITYSVYDSLDGLYDSGTFSPNDVSTIPLADDVYTLTLNADNTFVSTDYTNRTITINAVDISNTVINNSIFTETGANGVTNAYDVSFTNPSNVSWSSVITPNQGDFTKAVISDMEYNIKSNQATIDQCNNITVTANNSVTTESATYYYCQNIVDPVAAITPGQWFSNLNNVFNVTNPGTGVDTVTTQYSIDGGAYTGDVVGAPTVTMTLPELSHGNHNITIRSTASAGLVYEYTETFDINYELNAPVITFSFPEDTKMNNFVTNVSQYINITDDNQPVTCNATITEFNQAPVFYPDCYDIQHTFTTLGDADISVTATDAETNEATNNVAWNVNLYRITYTFENIVTGNLLTDVNITEAGIGVIGSLGNTTSLTYFINPGDYEFTATRQDYETEQFNFTKSSEVSSENIRTSLNAIYTITLYNEETRALFNMDNVTITSTVECGNGNVELPITLTNNTVGLTGACYIVKITFRTEIDLVPTYRSVRMTDEINRNIYLIDLRTSTAVKVEFNLYDLVNKYDDMELSFTSFFDNTQYEITWDKVDISNKIVTYLLQDGKYSITLESSNLPPVVQGNYVSSEDGISTLALMDLKFSVSGSTVTENIRTRNYLGGVNNNTIIVMYEDLEDTVESATVTIRERDGDGTIIAGPFTINAETASYAYVIPGELNSTPLYAELSIISSLREDPIKDTRIHQVNEKIILGMINFNLDMDWIIMIFLGFLALTLTVSTASVGALVIVGVAALFMTFGWFSLSVYTLIVAILIAIINIIREGEKK